MKGPSLREELEHVELRLRLFNTFLQHKVLLKTLKKPEEPKISLIQDSYPT